MKEEVENASNSEYSYYSYSESESESTESESESTTSSDSYYSDEPAKPATDVLKMAYAIPPADVSKQLACGADEEDDEDNPNVKIAEVCAAKKLEGEPKSSEKTTAAKPVGKAKSKSQRPSSQALLEASAAAPSSRTRSAYMQFMKNYLGDRNNFHPTMPIKQRFKQAAAAWSARPNKPVIVLPPRADGLPRFGCSKCRYAVVGCQVCNPSKKK